VLISATGDDGGLRLRQFSQGGGHCRQHRRGDDDRPSPGIGEHERVFASGELGVDRHRNDPCLDRAQEGGRKVDRVVKAEEDALLRKDVKSAQQIGKPAHPIGEFGISVATAIVDEGRLRPTPGNEVALEKVGSGIISH